MKTTLSFYNKKITDTGETIEIDVSSDFEEVSDKEIITANELKQQGIDGIFTHIQYFRRNQKSKNKRIAKKRLLPLDVNYVVQDTEKMDQRKSKRNIKHSMEHTFEEHYDYDLMDKEYYEQQEQAASNPDNTAHFENEQDHGKLNYTGQILKEAQVPVNCTDKDRKGYGWKAIRCLFKDIGQQGIDNNVEINGRRILIFWLLVYALFAIPSWVIKGWCCCCCRCKCCFPYDLIYEMKQDIIRNPPGTLHLKDGTIKIYRPTKYEKDAFHELQVRILNF